VLDLGYTALEVSIDEADVIYDGRLNDRRLGHLLEALPRTGLRYALHAPASLDLRQAADHQTHLAIGRCCIEAAAALGAEVVVLHYEQFTGEASLETLFRDSVLRLRDWAISHDLTLTLENIEVERTDRVVEFISAHGENRLGLTYDVAHDWLASHRFGYGVEESARRAAPFCRHVHVSDNFGKFAELRLRAFPLYKTVPHRELLPVGRGDLHLPIGYGSIPFCQILTALKPYRGMIISEHRQDRYRREEPEITEQLRRLAEWLEMV
jgi:sugar phosphate isomerase/epimerase